MSVEPREVLTFKAVQLSSSDWQCELFGCGNGIVYRPAKGNEPNAWWRFWQYVILGNKWVRPIAPEKPK